MKSSPGSILFTLVAGVLVLSGCGGASDVDSVEAPSTVAEAGSKGFSDADVLFAQSMIPHHVEAIVMADMALAPEAGAGAEIVALASQIKGAQDPEIAQMTAMLQAWDRPLAMPGMVDHEGMEGMMPAGDMAALAALSGAEFDTAWATAMIVHHEGAVSMAQTVLESGSDPEVLALAEAIISGQQTEIDEMNALLGR